MLESVSYGAECHIYLLKDNHRNCEFFEFHIHIYLHHLPVILKRQTQSLFDCLRLSPYPVK